MRPHRVSCLTLIALLATIVLVARAGDDPTTQHTVVDATDKDAIAGHMGQEVVVVGEIATAAWSASGKVMNIDFKGADQSRLLAVVFERNRKTLDEMFNGDLATALSGAKVRLTGRLQEYGGRDERWKGRPQIIIERSSQITITEPAAAPATRAATQPATMPS
jgi:hypothetical protein